MISWDRLVVVADETVRAQHMNVMPGLENCENFDKHIEFIHKHKKEINDGNLNKIRRARRMCEQSLANKKPLRMNEIYLVNYALGFTIGRTDEDSIALRDTAARSLASYKRKPTKRTWLDYKKWLKYADHAWTMIAGARAEEMKMKEVKE